jgi:hypothetical protein
MASALRACARASIVSAINSWPSLDWELAAEGQAMGGRVMDPGAAAVTPAKEEAVNVASNRTHSTGTNEFIVHGMQALPSSSFRAAATKNGFEQTMQGQTAIVNKGRTNRPHSGVFDFSLWARWLSTEKLERSHRWCPAAISGGCK